MVNYNFPVWYKQSAFRFTANGKNIYIDPWEIPEGEPKADIILITHTHFDHFDQKTINRLYKEGTTIIFAPQDAKEKLKNLNTEIVKPAQAFEHIGLKIKTTPAYNPKKEFHPKPNNWVGYIIEINGAKFYHAGDTSLISEMADIKTDVAMLPIGGHYTMDVEEALEAAKIISPKLVIPMHYGYAIGSKEDAEKFKEQCEIETKILEPIIPFAL